MRPIRSWPRANWIHIGSEQAGPRIAAPITVQLWKAVDGLRFRSASTLAEVIPGLANASVQRIADITPVAWTAKHP